MTSSGSSRVGKIHKSNILRYFPDPTNAVMNSFDAGCATTLSLIRNAPQTSFVLVDNSDPTQFKIGESLPPRANQVLFQLSPSVSERLSRDTAQGHHTRCAGNASVWQSPVLQETFSIMSPYGAGWHLDRHAFDESLREHVRSFCADREAQDRLFVKGTFSSVKKNDDGTWAMTVTSEGMATQVYSAKWIVDASGRQASVSRKVRAPGSPASPSTHVYQLGAKTIKVDGRTLIEASKIGWWYSSRLPDQRRLVAFHTDDCDAAAKSARNKEAFLDMLHEDTKYISQSILVNDYRSMIGTNAKIHDAPVLERRSSCFWQSGERWCAVGDAAMAFDPLSSQGIITALRGGSSVGVMLANQMVGRATQAGPEDMESVAKVFEEVRVDYEKNKSYFYTQSMFCGAFWSRRTTQNS
ncbi:Tryptophan halogenase [Rhizoctonia solani]|uniref:Tryptophan halogenase n=1 Tax=Rhizoctonia solani TaxID=456999 RepID=A0A8H7M0E9_9AGAM|nr:Tryptophan halogenase [Rhizoctonia solani]